MLLSHRELKQAVRLGHVAGVRDELINGTSIDVTLGSTLLIEAVDILGTEISLRDKQALTTNKIVMGPNGYLLAPGEFVLAQTEQVFHLPMYLSAEYKLKSSMARIGLEHLNAGWCDPGWNGSVLTLEFKNVSRAHYIRIRPGDRIGQVVFFRHSPVPFEDSYAVRGRYNGDSAVSGAKPDLPSNVTIPRRTIRFEVHHGSDCQKEEHYDGCAYLHGALDDSPYLVDGVRYCGRCHELL